MQTDNSIAVVVRRKYHYDQIMEVFIRHGYPYMVHQVSDDWDISLKQISDIVEQGAQVLIAGDFSARKLFKHVQAPLIPIHRSKIPFSEAIHEALTVSKRAAILWSGDSSDLPKAESEVGRYPGLVQLATYSRPEELPDIMEKLSAEGIGAVIGTSIINSDASEHNLLVVNITYDEDDILTAVRIARHTLQALIKQQQYTETLRIIQNKISEGVIAIDGSGNISIVNEIAAGLLNQPEEKLLGLSIRRTELSCHELSRLLTDAAAFSGKILTVGGTTVTVSGQPIMVHEHHTSSILMIRSIEQLQQMEQKVRSQLYARGLIATKTFEDIVGTSPATVQTIEFARRFAATDCSILVTGETGVGKEIFVQSIHNASARKNKPFVVVNCAALPENLIESELFGYEKGSFTGALSSGKQGLFERGHGGTVFLDEIGELPYHIQARLLRVLQEREVTPIGSGRTIPINIRVIAATNRDLIAMVHENKFREDLYYRLNVLTLHIPPLRARRDDIPLLARSFIEARQSTLGVGIREIEEDALNYLASLSYPGNIRQLINLVERTIALSDNGIFSLAAVQLASRPVCWEEQHKENESDFSDDYESKIHTVRAEQLRTVLKECDGNRKLAAEKLQISISTLYRRMRELGI
ncbi:sigma 54-interacting transcriptional regulator [Clostridium transplantifaecale]|uniref:sigma 54-interacting transcriptional regulator n=1 Tax=Clostridium transplantifaecale TaxID=2479838 RepID=UPI000F63AA3B|nr:sigma 54-interacting transcriptional regulator [Clostridium transplantifaecale]